MIYDVRALQERLLQIGFDPGPIDGLPGPRTDSAIRAFKRSIGFRDRAFVGPLTWAALMEPAPDSSIPWMGEALKVRGLHERRDTARLVQWFDGSVSWLDPRDVPWCGAFMATCFRKWQPNVRIPDNPLGARNWGGFGVPCSPQFGSVLTFWRVSKSGWQGHVGFYYGEDETAFHVLGGNQSNAVNVTRVSKSRLLEVRWPLNVTQPRRRVYLTPGGQPLSMNEA